MFDQTASGAMVQMLNCWSVSESHHTPTELQHTIEVGTLEHWLKAGINNFIYTGTCTMFSDFTWVNYASKLKVLA